ncbi:MAG: hypothetical protein PF495_21150 [Spirochaetales bacterium]|nr:hypothetical protein [Spirochaetales bacterium]
MKKYAILIVGLFVGNSFGSMDLPDRESQQWYDYNLYIALDSVGDIVPDFPPDSRELITDKGKLGFGRYRKYKIGEEIEAKSKYIHPYSYHIKTVSNRGIVINAKNRYGGRDYIYDYEWNVAYYLILTDDEACAIGQALIDWVTCKKYQEISEEWKCILTALGYRGCYTGKLNYEEAKFDVLGTFGRFLACEKIRPEIWKILQGGEVFADDRGREKCVRGIISNYESYSPELQKEVLEYIKNYLDLVDDESTVYSKNIAEFVLNKGGEIPDRLYWAYDTSWIPLNGSAGFLREGETKCKAMLYTTEISSEDQVSTEDNP